MRREDHAEAVERLVRRVLAVGLLALCVLLMSYVVVQYLR